MADGGDADPWDDHGVRSRPRRLRGDCASRHDQADLRADRHLTRGRLHAMQPGRRPAGDAGGQWLEGHSRDAGEEAAAEGAVMSETPALFSDGKAYERFMGRWSRLAGDIFLDWLDAPEGLRAIDARVRRSGCS